MTTETLKRDNPHETLRITWAANASDARDKIFGVLGLIQKDTGLMPNYSLSALHIFVGVVGHILPNLKIPDILTLASGQASPATYPSWMPYWRELGTFKLDTEIQLAIRVTSEFEEAFEKRTDSHPF
jgi:hypothetical protein